MHSVLKEIIEHKHREVLELKKTKDFKAALKDGPLSFIGEIKRQSPSKGSLAAITDPISLLDQYVAGNIAAVSVLTDSKYFGGSLDDLKQVSNHLSNKATPVLRKDFIVDEIQIMQALLNGADAVLLIVAVLGDRTKELLNYAKQLGLDALVEVHNQQELEYAVKIGAEIIGINNRNLHTFEQDINVCLDLVKLIPDHIVKVAESAIKTVDDIRKLNKAGFDAVLIGEALVTAADPVSTLTEMRAVL